jgi:hypothetical protein
MNAARALSILYMARLNSGQLRHSEFWSQSSDMVCKTREFRMLVKMYYEKKSTDLLKHYFWHKDCF